MYARLRVVTCLSRTEYCRRDNVSNVFGFFWIFLIFHSLCGVKKGFENYPEPYGSYLFKYELISSHMIAVITVQAKLYSMLVSSRISQHIDQRLPVEQPGFRPGMGCTDHIHTVRMVAEKSKEWGQTLWVASLDLEKAFDKVFFTAVLDALRQIGIDPGYIEAVEDLYSNLSVELDGASRSRDVNVEPGVIQGDPFSPALFINVLRMVMANLLPTWVQKRYGITVGELHEPNTCLHYLVC